MKILIILLLSLTALSAGAKQTTCTVFTLGNGANNYTRYTKRIVLVESPHSSLLKGNLSFDFPEAVPIENRQKTGAEAVYSFKVSLSYKDDESVWNDEQGRLSAQVSLYKGVEALTYHETSSNTLHTESDKRILDDGVVLFINAKVYSPIINKKIQEIKNKKITVFGKNLSVGDLVTEVGFQNAVEHLADQGLLKPSDLSVLQLNCSRE